MTRQSPHIKLLHYIVACFKGWTFIVPIKEGELSVIGTNEIIKLIKLHKTNKTKRKHISVAIAFGGAAISIVMGAPIWLGFFLVFGALTTTFVTNLANAKIFYVFESQKMALQYREFCRGLQRLSVTEKLWVIFTDHGATNTNRRSEVAFSHDRAINKNISVGGVEGVPRFTNQRVSLVFLPDGLLFEFRGSVYIYPYQTIKVAVGSVVMIEPLAQPTDATVIESGWVTEETKKRQAFKNKYGLFRMDCSNFVIDMVASRCGAVTKHLVPKWNGVKYLSNQNKTCVKQKSNINLTSSKFIQVEKLTTQLATHKDATRIKSNFEHASYGKNINNEHKTYSDFLESFQKMNTEGRIGNILSDILDINSLSLATEKVEILLCKIALHLSRIPIYHSYFSGKQEIIDALHQLEGAPWVNKNDKDNIIKLITFVKTPPNVDLTFIDEIKFDLFNSIEHLEPYPIDPINQIRVEIALGLMMEHRQKITADWAYLLGVFLANKLNCPVIHAGSSITKDPCVYYKQFIDQFNTKHPVNLDIENCEEQIAIKTEINSMGRKITLSRSFDNKVGNFYQAKATILKINKIFSETNEKLKGFFLTYNKIVNYGTLSISPYLAIQTRYWPDRVKIALIDTIRKCNNKSLLYMQTKLDISLSKPSRLNQLLLALEELGIVVEGRPTSNNLDQPVTFSEVDGLKMPNLNVSDEFDFCIETEREAV